MRRLLSLWSAVEGTAAVMFGLALPVVLGFAGVALDYSYAVKVRSALQTDADAAVLSGVASSTRADQSVSRTQAMFQAGLRTRGIDPAAVTSAVSIEPTSGDVTLTANYDVKTNVAQLFGFPTFKVAIQSAAGRAANTRVLDIVMCIDATGSMQPTIDAVKSNALRFHAQLNSALEARDLLPFDAVRARPIFFRDFGGNYPWYSIASGGQVDKYPNGFVSRPAGDGRNLGDDVPMRAADDFFNLVTDAGNFSSFVAPEIESGGGDYPESGLECLNEGLDSNWTKIGDSVRTADGNKPADTVFSLIAIWTDNNAQVPSFPHSLLNPNYPNASKMPRNYSGLAAKWNDRTKIPQDNKLIAMFVPSSAPDSAWRPIKAWDKYMAAGSLTDGTNNTVARIADALAAIPSQGIAARLTH